MALFKYLFIQLPVFIEFELCEEFFVKIFYVLAKLNSVIYCNGLHLYFYIYFTVYILSPVIFISKVNHGNIFLFSI